MLIIDFIFTRVRFAVATPGLACSIMIPWPCCGHLAIDIVHSMPSNVLHHMYICTTYPYLLASYACHMLVHIHELLLLSRHHLDHIYGYRLLCGSRHDVMPGCRMLFVDFRIAYQQTC